jgi:hypothetical protein
VRRAERRPLRRLGEERHRRCDQEVCERDGFAGKERLLAQQPRQLREHGARLGHRGRNGGLVGRKPHHARSHHAVKDDDIADAGEQIPVVDIHHLIHARRALGIGRRKRRRRQHAVEVAQDGLGLVEDKTIMLQHRHAPEGMAGKVFRRLKAAGRQRRETIGRALLFQHRQHGACERAARNGMDRKFRHDDLLTQWLLFSRFNSGSARLQFGFPCKTLDQARPAAVDILPH